MVIQMRTISDHDGFFFLFEKEEEKYKLQTKLLVNNKMGILFWSGCGKGAFRQHAPPTVVTATLWVGRACGSRIDC